MTGGGLSAEGRPPVFKAVGVSLAITSGVFIGVSFVLKKKGLLAANLKEGKEAGEGYGYLKNAWWWTGMTLMILGEICNFCAYAFVDAILVTPMGALSVVITAILSGIFLKERLSFVGKVGCFMCIIGSVVIVINAPEQSSVSTIQDMKHFILSPGFLSYASVVIVGCICVVIWVAPNYGKKSMMVYLTVCSLIGGLSVVATQGLGAAVVAQISGTPQFNQWFLYLLLVFVVVTLLVEIVYLNKALNIFNTALVTPTYYVYFTSATIVTSAILFRGFKGTPSSIATVVMGFLQICSGVVLLQLSKSSKNIPDAEIFRGDLNQIRTVAEQSEPESEPRADTIRGTAAILRRISVTRRTAEADEARRIHEERLRDLHTPLSAGESIEWDGVRRRVTTTGAISNRRNTLSGQHPPSLSRIPDDEEAAATTAEDATEGNRRRSMSVDEAIRQKLYDDNHPETFLERFRGLFLPKRDSRSNLKEDSTPMTTITSPHRDLRDASATRPRTARARVHTDSPRSPPHRPLPYNNLTSQSSPHINHVTFQSPTETKSFDFPVSSPNISRRGESSYSPVPNPSGIRPDSRGSAKRQYSFNFIHRHEGSPDESARPNIHPHHHARHGSWLSKFSPAAADPKTEEEMLGLVKRDSVSGVDEEKLAPVAATEETESSVSGESTTSSDEEDDKGRESWAEKEWETRGRKR